MDLSDLGEQYASGTLEEQDLCDTPVEQWQRWLADAVEATIAEPHAAVLATVDPNGWPQARNVLIRSVGQDGFVFFTNYESAKAAELDQACRASLVFSWLSIHRQVRVVGAVERTTAAQSDDYFDSRPRGSQIGAWASPQSDILASRQELEEAVAAVERRFEGQTVPRPSFWGGYKVVPEFVEFWQGRPSRLHDRLRYAREANGAWRVDRLAP